jgi:hypothetical protein
MNKEQDADNQIDKLRKYTKKIKRKLFYELVINHIKFIIILFIFCLCIVLPIVYHYFK